MVLVVSKEHLITNINILQFDPEILFLLFSWRFWVTKTRKIENHIFSSLFYEVSYML